MITIGLTGSIGMGKTTTAAMFAEAGALLYDADAEVHRLYSPGGAAVGPVEAAFPGVVRDGSVDRAALSAKVLGDGEALARLNAIVWPLMGEARAAFFDRATSQGAEFVVLDIPMLLETGGERSVDAVVVVTAPMEIQRRRVLARPGMTAEKFAAILGAQMPDAEKRRRADYIVETGEGLDHAKAQVAAILEALRQAPEAGD